MPGKRPGTFRIGGVGIRIHPSWFILAGLITTSLAMGLFPARFPDLSPVAWWGMGLLGAFGLFASILLHELSHTWVARRMGLPIEGITLFLFGGVSELPHEPQKAKVEFWMAIAGPLMSFVLAAVFYGIVYLGRTFGWPDEWMGILAYLSVINLVLGIFNLVPAFPLDGGRVLRSLVWGATGDFAKATRIASAIGAGLGLALVLLGALRMLTGDFMGGLWWVLIGLFIRTAAQSSLQQIAFSRHLSQGHVRDFMNTHPVAVPADLPIRHLVEDYLYKYDYRTFPVTDGERLVGCVGLREVKNLPRESWDMRKVGQVMQACGGANTVAADADVNEALKRMKETGVSPLLVTAGSRLEGVLSARDLMHQMSVRMELEKT